MSITVKCHQCGKEFELGDNYKAFAEKYPERLNCPECYKAKKGDAKPATKKTTTTSAEPPISAKDFRKVYDSLLAEFQDLMDKDVMYQVLGGFTSTIIINKQQAARFRK